MEPVQCPQCQSSFDVSHLEPGSVFVCGACRAQLTVPSARPAPGLVPRGGRGAGRRTRTRHEPAPTNPPNRLPLIVAGAGGGLVILLIVLILVLSNSSEPPIVAESPAAAGPTLAEQIGALNDRMLSHSSDPAELLVIHREARALKAFGLAHKVAVQAIEIDANLAWAHEELGDVKFDGSGLPSEDEVLYPTEDWDLLQAAIKEGWQSKERQEELAAARERFLAHMKRLKEDAHYLRIRQVLMNVEKHPVFSDYEYQAIEERPYLIFVQKSADKQKAAQLEKKAKEKAAIYRCLYQTFNDRFAKPFGLSSLCSDVFAKDCVLKIWIFADRESFKRYHEYIGIPMDDSVAAYFSPTDQWIIIPEGGFGASGKIGNQNMDVNVSFHEGTHQLIHYYTKQLVEKATGEEVSWTDHRLESKSHWFQEGVADWFGSAVRKGESWSLFESNLYGLAGWKSDRDEKQSEWTFEELLSAEDSYALQQRGNRMAVLFYAQAWAFVDFLWNFENGKYRDKFLEYFKRELHGESGLRVFKEVFGLAEVKDSEMEKEYKGYVNELLGGI
jgi:hypothetical protein